MAREERKELTSNVISFTNSDIKNLGVPTSDYSTVLGIGVVTEYGWVFTLRANISLKDIHDRYSNIIYSNAVFQASVRYCFGRKYDVIGGKSRSKNFPF